MIYENILQLVGNTPLVALQKYSKNRQLNAEIIAKVEFFNPGGSVKDRVALNMIAEAEKQAQIIRGQGDQQAVAIWNNAAGVDPQFYAFYRSLEAYKNALADKENTSMVLAPNSEFFDFFRKMDATGCIGYHAINAGK